MKVLRSPLLLAALCGSAAAQPQTEFEVFAIRYATLPQFRVSGLVAGADTGRRLDIAMMVWLLKGPDGRVVLVDAGFKPREDLMNRWRPLNYETPAAAVERFGVKPDAVTDIIVSHIHWDHFDGADLFPKARIWIQREEYEYHVDSTGRVKNRAIDATDAAMAHKLRTDGRVSLVDGDAREIIPGITVYTGGKHTFQSQFVGVRVQGGTAVIASDNAYLYENLERQRPIAQTLDSVSNLAAQRRMLSLASRPILVIPGHDPLVFARFEQVIPGVARIR
jgi:glyoxylase-like metal-dependent hydrolase (beta-lactamase superfamily II)